MSVGGRSTHDRCMYTTTEIPLRKHAEQSIDPSTRGRRGHAVAATLLAGLLTLAICTRSSGGGEAPHDAPPTWQPTVAAMPTAPTGN